MDAFQISGLDTLQMFLQNLSPRATDYLAAEMNGVLQDVFAESQMQVPVETGALKASGHVDDVDRSPGQIVGQIGYGMEYALIVHENLSAKHAPPTKAKFLEDPMMSALENLSFRLQGRMEAALVGAYAAGASREVVGSVGGNLRGPDLRAGRNRTHARAVLAESRAKLAHLQAHPPERFKASRGRSIAYWGRRG